MNEFSQTSQALEILSISHLAAAPHPPSTIPREHRLVVNGSFGDRFVEGIYLFADENTPCIQMYGFKSKTRIKVKDFKAYPEDFPFHDPTCHESSPHLTRDDIRIRQNAAGGR